MLSGEAGIGKSRLAAALMQPLANEPHTTLALLLLPSADQKPASSDYRPHRARRRLCRATTRCKASSTSSTRSCGRLRCRPEDAGLIADMLSLPNDGRYPEIELAPPRAKPDKRPWTRSSGGSRRSPASLLPRLF